MDPPYVLIVGGGWTSSDAGGPHDFGIGQFGGDFTLGSAQGSSDSNCGGVCVAPPSFSSVESCQLGRSLKARSWRLNSLLS